MSSKFLQSEKIESLHKPERQVIRVENNEEMSSKKKKFKILDEESEPEEVHSSKKAVDETSTSSPSKTTTKLGKVVMEAVMSFMRSQAKDRGIYEFVDSLKAGKPKEVPSFRKKGKTIQTVSISKVVLDKEKYAVLKVHTEKNVFAVFDWKYVKDVLSFQLSSSDNNGKYITMIGKSSPFSMDTTLHNFILTVCNGQILELGESVDHINIVSHDNRSDNLRAATESMQQTNKDWDSRMVELENGQWVALPHRVQYRSDRYKKQQLYLELRNVKVKKILDKEIINGKYLWKGTASDERFEVKLAEALAHIKKIEDKHGDIPSLCGEKYDMVWKNEMRCSLNEILKASGFPKPEIKPWLVEEFKKVEMPKLKIKDQQAYDKLQEMRESGKKRRSKLPDNCGVKQADVPTYCSYYPAEGVREERFVIDRHPTLIDNGKRSMSFGSGTSLKNKFEKMLAAMKMLNKGKIPTNDKTDRKKREIQRELPDDLTEDIVPDGFCWKKPSGRAGGHFYIASHPGAVAKSTFVLSDTSKNSTPRDKLLQAEKAMKKLDKAAEAGKKLPPRSQW